MWINKHIPYRYNLLVNPQLFLCLKFDITLVTLKCPQESDFNHWLIK